MCTRRSTAKNSLLIGGHLCTHSLTYNWHFNFQFSLFCISIFLSMWTIPDELRSEGITQEIELALVPVCKDNRCESICWWNWILQRSWKLEKKSFVRGSKKEVTNRSNPYAHATMYCALIYYTPIRNMCILYNIVYWRGLCGGSQLVCGVQGAIFVIIIWISSPTDVTLRINNEYEWVSALVSAVTGN